MGYVYLIESSLGEKWKLGYSSTYPKVRLKAYYSHGNSISIKGFWKVPEKCYEKYIQQELLRKQFKKSYATHQKEWWIGKCPDSFIIDEILYNLDSKDPL